MSTPTVLIAGGGIGGLALAVGLAERGIDSEVFERAKNYGNQGSGVELTPNGVKSLDHLSPELGAAVRAAGWPSVRHEQPMHIMSSEGQILKTRDLKGFPDKWGAPLVGILRSELHRLLAEAAYSASRGTVTVHHSSEVTGVDTGRRAVGIRLADGRAVAGDVVVGADGVRSTLRRTVAPDAETRYLFTSVRGIAKRPAEYSDGFVFVGSAGHFFAEAVDEHRMFWSATVKAPEGSWPAKPVAQAKEDLLELWGDWASPLPETVAGTGLEDIVVTDVHDCPPLSRWSHGRVTLLGDAAHPIGPVLGQGANMALEDAARLSDLLASERDVPAALRQYERTRAARANKIVRHSRLIARLGHTTNPVVGRVRDWMIRRMRQSEDTYRDQELFSYQP